MKNSKFFSLNLKDVLHGLITAILGAVITGVTQSVQTGTFDVKTVGITAGVAGLSYIGKQLVTDTEGNLGKN